MFCIVTSVALQETLGFQDVEWACTVGTHETNGAPTTSTENRTGITTIRTPLTCNEAAIRLQPDNRSKLISTDRTPIKPHIGLSDCNQALDVNGYQKIANSLSRDRSSDSQHLSLHSRSTASQTY